MTEAAKEREGEKERWRRTMLFSKATQKIEKARNEPATAAGSPGDEWARAARATPHYGYA